MYGIEYSTLANLIKDDDVDEAILKKSINDNSFNREISNESSILSFKSSTLTENLLTKLHNLKKCPAYLLPKTTLNSTPTFNTQTSSITSNNNSIKQNKNYYTDDFILLSEFSEIEGPKPLLTIPTDGGTGFNKNEYSLHLMCVDFHSHVHLHHDDESVPSRRQNKFNLTQDTSIINYWDSANSVAACVHHFNLYDLEARGFVRPFCLAYISYDRTKPVVYFEQIRKRFDEITDLLKKSNFNLFKLDLEQRCLDLKLTRELFVKWSQEAELDHLKQIRSQLAKEHKLDIKTCGRLTASSTSDKAKQLQLNAIDSLVKELENVIDVIKAELKAKNWIKLNKIAKKNVVKNSMNNSTDCVSLPSSDISLENNTIINRTNRSLTYPLNKNNINGIKTSCHSNRKLKFALRSPKIFINILVGNLNTLQQQLYNNDFVDIDGFCSGIDFQQLNQSSKLQQHKTMKRLHQLSYHTAKQAINEMRLMQLYFSTPYYLLKFRELATPVSNFNKTNFWSIMCGEIAVANFATHVDTFNLHKNNLIKMSNFSNKKFRNPNESGTLYINKLHVKEEAEDEEDTLLYSSMSADKQDSVKTQFYSPVTERTNIWLINQSNDTNDSDIEILSKVTAQLSNETKSEENFSTARETAWETAIEQFLDMESDTETNKKEIVTEEEEENEEFYDNYDEETISSNFLENNENHNNNQNGNITEENEYDFVNSLLTADYKPYNQYSDSLNKFTDPYLAASSLSLSSSFTSPAIIYSAFNRCKYQANLTDKLIQIIEFNFEETLKQLLNNFHVLMPHLFYSLLKGRPVIFVSRHCDDLPYLTAIIDCLSNFVPNSFDSLNDSILNNNKPKFTSSPCNNGFESAATTSNSSDKTKMPQLKSVYERKPIKLNDLKYCKLFGLSLMISKDDTCCSQDCHNNLIKLDEQIHDNISLNGSITSKKRSNSFFKHQHKHYHQNKLTKDDEDSLLLKYIPITVRNYVSIFDLDKGTFTGPKYNGIHLKNCLHKAKQMQQDSIIYLYLLTHLVKHYIKIAFLYNYSILFDYHSDTNESRSKISTRRNSLARNSFDLNNDRAGYDFINMKRERIKRYFAWYNNILSNDASNLEIKSAKSSYSTLSLASLGSLASSIIGLDSQKQQHIQRDLISKTKKISISSFSEDDFELLKIILALVDLNTSKRSVSSNASNNASNSGSNSPTNLNLTVNFDQTDFNIVNHLLRSLQMKQIYLYELATRKRKLKENNQLKAKNDSSQASSKNTSNLIDKEIQFSLLVEYEELTVFNSKK